MEEVKEKNNHNYRDLLPFLNRTELKKLAKEEGITYRTALNIINGNPKRPNYAFLTKVLAQAEKNKATIDRIKKLTSQ